VSNGGFGVGLAEVAHQRLRDRKVDPRKVVSLVQADIVRESMERAAAMRAQGKAMSEESTESLTAALAERRKAIAEIEAGISAIQKELEYLYDASAEHRPRMEPIAEDLAHAMRYAAVVGMTLDRIELERDISELDAKAAPGTARPPLP
jgi:hypothetical protein